MMSEGAVRYDASKNMHCRESVKSENQKVAVTLIRVQSAQCC